MKALGARSVFATETSRGTLRTSYSLALFGVLLLGTLSAGGCYHPPRDKHGNLPDDAVRNFIEAVKARDYGRARSIWYGASMRISGVIKFEDFCSEYKNIDLDRCRISKAQRGKAGFAMINIDWDENGEQMHDEFGLKIVDGEWKMERGYYW